MHRNASRKHIVDLWSLFDFAQPGLLGALNNLVNSMFAPSRTKMAAIQNGGKPAGADRTSDFTPNQRRGSRDLPQKIEVESCKQLTLSGCKNSSTFRLLQIGNNSKHCARDAAGRNRYVRFVTPTETHRAHPAIVNPEPRFRDNSPKLTGC